jgi:hypothetical protein
MKKCSMAQNLKEKSAGFVDWAFGKKLKIFLRKFRNKI